MSFRIAKPRRRSSLSISTSSSHVSQTDDRLPFPKDSNSTLERRQRHHQRYSSQTSFDAGLSAHAGKEETTSNRTSLNDLLLRSRTTSNETETGRPRPNHLRTQISPKFSQTQTGQGRMDLIGDERDKVWGMPDFYESVEREIEPGIKVVSLPEVSEDLLETIH